MLIPAFQLQLNNSVLTGLVCIGKYDGKHPNITAATSAGKILMHTPNESSDDGSPPIKFLNINRKISALGAGALRPQTPRDILFVGSPTSLMAYDVEANSDLFFKDIPDGVNTLIFGQVPNIEAPLVVVGGNCSIQGFNHEGSELFWTVTGDNVTSLSFCDVESDGVNELLVGSADNEIRIFQQEEIVSEVTESDTIVGISPLRLALYGYALANGTIGVYNRTKRQWRAKSKNRVTSIRGFDLDADGAPELCSGWSNGKIEVRNDTNGELVFKERMGSCVAALLQSDYRMDGRQQIICASTEGQVLGFLPAEAELATAGHDSAVEEKALAELLARKQELDNEIRSMEKVGKSAGTEAGLPPGTRVSLNGKPCPERNCLEFEVRTTTSAVIRGVMAFAEDGGVFPDESLLVWPAAPCERVVVPLAPPRDIRTAVHFHVLCGVRGASQYSVYEMKQELPRFCMFTVLEASPPELPAGRVTFAVRERFERVVMWLTEAFNAQGFDPHPQELDVTFQSLRDGALLRFHMTRDGGGTASIACDDMEVAGNVVQDMCAALKIEELASTAEFPAEMARLKDTLERVEEHNAVRMKMTAEIADASNLVKALVIRAEDARILGDMALMKRTYAELFSLNNQLMGEFQKRATNHQQLLDALKDVNGVIQKASRLRVGSAKTEVVTACRKAIKSNNIAALEHIIKNGKAAGM